MMRSISLVNFFFFIVKPMNYNSKSCSVWIRGHFYVLRDWLKNNQSQAAIITSAVPPHVHMFFKLTSFFSLWRQRCNMEFWLLTKQATSSEVHTRTVIPWETLRTWGPRILLLQAFESVRTSHQNYMELKEQLPRRMLLLSLQKTPLFAIFLLSLSISLNINLFSTKLLSCSFSLLMCRDTISLIYLYTADVDFVLFSAGKIPTKEQFCFGRTQSRRLFRE